MIKVLGYVRRSTDRQPQSIPDQRREIEAFAAQNGMSFVRENELQPGQKYPMVIEGMAEGDAEGTLDPSGFIGGNGRCYKSAEREKIFREKILRLSAEPDRKRRKNVFGRAQEQVVFSNG